MQKFTGQSDLACSCDAFENQMDKEDSEQPQILSKEFKDMTSYTSPEHMKGSERDLKAHEIGTVQSLETCVKSKLKRSRPLQKKQEKEMALHRLEDELKKQATRIMEDKQALRKEKFAFLKEREMFKENETQVNPAVESVPLYLARTLLQKMQKQIKIAKLARKHREEVIKLKANLKDQVEAIHKIYNHPYKMPKHDTEVRYKEDKKKVDELKERLMKAETASLESDSEHATLEDATSSFFQTLTHLLGEKERAIKLLKEVAIKDNVSEHILNTLELIHKEWFWGKLSRDGAYAQLKDKAKGSFLVRESESYPGSYALQINSGRNIETFLLKEIQPNSFGFSNSGPFFLSIPELIAYYSKHNISSFNCGPEVKLQHPIVNHENISSLAVLKARVQNLESELGKCYSHNFPQEYFNLEKPFVEAVFLPSDLPPLSIEYVTEYVHCMSSQWDELGCGLGMGDLVKDLRLSEKPPRSKCLHILQEWIDSADNVSWFKLLELLYNIGQCRTVHCIVKKFKEKKKPFSNVL